MVLSLGVNNGIINYCNFVHYFCFLGNDAMNDFEKEVIRRYQEHLTWLENEYPELQNKFKHKLSTEFVAEDYADQVKEIIKKHLDLRVK